MQPKFIVLNRAWHKFQSAFYSFFFISLPWLLCFERSNTRLLRPLAQWLKPKAFDVPPWFDAKMHIYPSDLVIILLFAITLLDLRFSTKHALLKTSTYWLVALLLWALASVIFSPLAHCAVFYQRLFTLLTPLLALLAAFRAPPKTTQLFLWSLLFAGLFQAIIAIMQYFTQQPVGLFFLHELKDFFQSGIIPCPGSLWVVDEWLERTCELPHLCRSAGTFIHANPLGFFLAASLFAFFALYPSLQKWKRPFFLLFASAMIFALVLTFSRSALFGGILGALFFFWRTRSFYSTLFGVTACALLLSVGLLHKQITLRGGVLGQSGLSIQSDRVRIDQNRIALALIAKHPLFGIGYGQFTHSKECNDWSQNSAITMVHNSALLLAVEIGLPGLLFLILFLFHTGKCLFGALSPEKLAAGSIFILMLLVAAVDFYPLVQQHAKIISFLFFGILFSKKSLPVESQLQNLKTISKIAS